MTSSLPTQNTVKVPAAFVVACLLASASGCFGSKSKPDGMGLTLVSYYHEAVYMEIWSNEYPESDGYPAAKGRLGSGIETLLHCAEGDANYRDRGNYMKDGNFLKVVLYELEETTLSEPVPGEKLAEMRWDDLKCFRRYTVVFDEGGNLALYECSCDNPEDRRGVEPWPPSPQ